MALSDSQAYARASDEELVALIADRDMPAFEALYDRHAGHVNGMCIRRLRNPEAAAEIAQDVFSKLWHGTVRFDPGRAKFTTWLFTIVRNRCIDAARKTERAPVSEELFEGMADTSSVDPEQAAYAAERRALLTDALKSLPDAQRTAVELCIVRGYTHTEAAEHLGEPLGTVKSRVKIGLEKLKSRMSRAGEGVATS